MQLTGKFLPLALLACLWPTCILSSPIAVPAAESTQLDPSVLTAAGNSVVPYGNADFTCKALKLALGGNATVTASAGSAYTTLEDFNWSETCWLPAACIITPKFADEVSRAIKILTSLGTKFAVRSGGHKDAPGFASIGQDGVLIALSNLNTVSLSADGKIATVGPGNRWDAVYNHLLPQGVSVIGGRVGIVGVGGFVLGGGLSYFSNEYGLSMDNVARFGVVLADGAIVDATATHNSDLFFGLKGGSSNFGIVTEYDLYTHPLRDFYFEARAYSLNQSSDVLRALATYQKVGQLDQKSSVTFQFESTGPVVLFQYSVPTQRPAALDAFYNISPYNQVIPATNGSLTTLSFIAEQGFPSTPTRTHGQTVSHKVDADFMIEAYHIYQEEIKDLSTTTVGTYVPQAISKHQVEYGIQQPGGNALGLEPIPQQWIDIFLTWTSPVDDAANLKALDRIISRITAASKARNVHLPYLFMNDAGFEQPVLQSFGKENVDKLTNIARKWDPKGVFQTLQNDGFLLSKIHH